MLVEVVGQPGVSDFTFCLLGGSLSYTTLSVKVECSFV